MNDYPDRAFILAAGLGSRLRPLTNLIPKPMVCVHGKPMIDHALDALSNAGVKNCVVNTHYKAEILHNHLATRKSPQIIFSYEKELLDTGGGIYNAISHFSEPFYVLSGDSVWENKNNHDALMELAAAWDPSRMDILILLQPVDTMKLTQGVGDYDLDEHGRAIRNLSKAGRYMFTSIRINAPHIFVNSPFGSFSYLQLLDEAQKKGRLYGQVHSGIWHHISTPQDLESVNCVHE